MKSLVGCLLALFVIVGCGGHDAGHVAEPGGAGQAAAPKQTKRVAAEPVELTHDLALNGEEKWQMDEHTRTMFATMAGRVEGNAAADARAWVKTGGELNKDITELIQGCTMEGAGHDELHKFLMLYLPAVDELAGSGSTASAGRVRELLELYPEYFE